MNEPEEIEFEGRKFRNVVEERFLGRRESDRIPATIAANSAKIVAGQAVLARSLEAMRLAVSALEHEDSPGFDQRGDAGVCLRCQAARELGACLMLAKERGLT